ncbi:protein translocase SEC61 complex subunit gamma [Candidatus Woesearchaeota archaeon]|nr:protein translocase SEC61 complex subunit gamma [Candidatus Woesearchaeota archaeon]
MNIASWPRRTKAYVLECRRVLKITKKPDSTEFKTIVKVSGIGMIIIGLIGFLITLIKELLLSKGV